MKNTLIDAGPLIALFDNDDHYHDRMLQFLKKYHGRLITTWPVITEVTHMLDFQVKVQINFLKWADSGGLHIVDLQHRHLNRMIEMTANYSNVPMDLADSSLMVIAEELDLKEIITIDSDYLIYRTLKRDYLKNIFEPFL